MFGDRPKQITIVHLLLLAVVYLRQSTQRQVDENVGSTAHQRSQAEYARHWGWPETAILTIEDDLGLSGTSVKNRTGWQRLLQLITDKRVGIIFVSDISRLNRSSDDFHLLASLCRQMGVLLVVDGRIVDFDDPTDSFMAEIRASVAQFENKLRTQTFQQSKRAKARAGQAVHTPPAGYEEYPKGKWIKDRDQAVRDAVERVFRDYFRLGTLGKLLKEYYTHEIKLPVRQAGELRWVSAYRVRLHRILTDIAYAGAYAYGRHVTIHGKTRKQTDPSAVIVVQDHHDPYVSLEDWERIQAQLRSNTLLVQQPAREGAALLQGILRCGRCHRIICTSYNGGGPGYTYACCQARRQLGAKLCWSVNGQRLDALIVPELMRCLEPPSLEAVIAATADVNAAYTATLQQRQAELVQARYEVDLAWRRFQSVDPANPRTKAAAEADHEGKAEALHALELRQAATRPSPPLTPTPEVLADIHRLAQDFSALWAAPSTSHQDRKALLRCFIREVELTANTDEAFTIEVRWVGGAVTRHTAQQPYLISNVTRRLKAQGLSQEQIVAELERKGIRDVKGRPYSVQSVRAVLRRDGRKGQPRTRPSMKEFRQGLEPLLIELAGRGLCDREIAEELNRRNILNYVGNPWRMGAVTLRRRRWGIPCGRAGYSAHHPLRAILQSLVTAGRSEGEIADEFNRQGLRGFTVELPWTAEKVTDLRHRLQIHRAAIRRHKLGTSEINEEAA